MHSMNILSKEAHGFEVGLSHGHHLSDSRLKTRDFNKTADVMVQSSQIERAIVWPTVFQRSPEHRLQDIVSEHLSVRRVVADLLLMLEKEEPLSPQTGTLPEPSDDRREEVPEPEPGDRPATAWRSPFAWPILAFEIESTR